MRVLLKGLRFDNCAEAGLGAQLVSHGCPRPEKIVITRGKGSSFASGAKHCCAFLWCGSEQQRGAVVSVVDGLSLSCLLGPIKALLVADRDKVSTSSASAAVSSQAVGSTLNSFQEPVVVGAKCKAQGRPPMRADVARKIL